MRSDDKKKNRKSNQSAGTAVSAVAVVMYILSAVMLLAAIFMVYYSIQSVMQYVTSYGLSISDVKMDVIQSVASTFLPYLTYSAVLFGIGKILSAVRKNSTVKTQSPVPASSDAYSSTAASSDARRDKAAYIPEDAETEDTTDTTEKTSDEESNGGEDKDADKESGSDEDKDE